MSDFVFAFYDTNREEKPTFWEVAFACHTLHRLSICGLQFILFNQVGVNKCTKICFGCVFCFWLGSLSPLGGDVVQ